MTESPPGEPGLASGPDIVEAKCSEQASEGTTIIDVRERFIAFYDREYHQVVRFCMRCGADLQAAEDATQEAFREAWERYVLPGRWDEDIILPDAWIRTVAYRYYKRPPGPRLRPLVILMPDYPDSLDNPNNTDGLSVETLTVLEALDSLDSELRAVMAFHLDRFTAKEIGVQIGIEDPQKVRDLLKKARKILAARLGATRDQGGIVS